MAIDQYRKQAESTSEKHKKAVLGRVMETLQIDLSEEMDRRASLNSRENPQKERVPDWFAD